MGKNSELDFLEDNLREKFKEFYGKFIQKDLELTLEEKESLIAKVIYDLIEEAIEKKFGAEDKINKEKKEEFKVRLIKVWNDFRVGYGKRKDLG